MNIPKAFLRYLDRNGDEYGRRELNDSWPAFDDLVGRVRRTVGLRGHGHCGIVGRLGRRWA